MISVERPDPEAGPAWPLLRDPGAADAPGAQHPLRGAASGAF